MADCNMKCFGLAESNKNVFHSITDLYDIITSTCSNESLWYIYGLVLENKSQVSSFTVFNPMWDILRLPHNRVCANICLEDEDHTI